MKSHFGIALITASIMCGNCAFAKDMKGTIVKCTPKTAQFLTESPRPVEAGEYDEYYIAIASMGRFCYSSESADECSDVNKFSTFTGDQFGAKIEPEKYVLTDDVDFNLSISRDGTKYSMLDFEDVVEGECKFVKNL